MKFIKLLLLSLLIFTGCSKSDTAPSLENQKMVYVQLSIPSVLSAASVNNMYALGAVNSISTNNSLRDYNAMLGVPTGATKQSSPISASNARIAANTDPITVTYTWNDHDGIAKAYQVTDMGNSYHWESFSKLAGGNDWLKYLDAVNLKDGSVGKLTVYDWDGADPTVILYDFSWTKIAGIYRMIRKYSYGASELRYNMATQQAAMDHYSGTGIDAYEDYNCYWGADGHGAWTSYDNTSTQTGTGTW